MGDLSETELAERSGTAPDQVRRLAEAGVLAPDQDGSFHVGDIQRVRLATAMDAAGLSIDDVGKAIQKGDLSLAFLDLIFAQPVGHLTTTYRELAESTGLSLEFVGRVHEAVGLAPPLPDATVREDDARMFPISQFVLGMGMSEESVVRVLRVYAENLARITQAGAQFFHSYVEEPLMASGMSESQLLAAASQLSPQLQQMVEDMMGWLYRRHQEHAITEHVLEHVEGALEQAGVARPRPARPPAMAFLDLAGYTRLTEERGDEVAAELASNLAALVQAGSRRHGGRPVKWLGDGVMFHFPDPGLAVRSALEMVEETPRAGLPPAHVGINAGPVVFRDGDYFGRTVNVAARIAGRATAGEVLVSEDVVRVCSPDGVRFEEVGPAELKGVTRPVLLFRAAQAG